MIHNPAISSRELMRYIPAPDFPTGGTVLVDGAAVEAYTTGRGHVTIRAKVCDANCIYKLPSCLDTRPVIFSG